MIRCRRSPLLLNRHQWVQKLRIEVIPCFVLRYLRWSSSIHTSINMPAIESTNQPIILNKRNINNQCWQLQKPRKFKYLCHSSDIAAICFLLAQPSEKDTWLEIISSSKMFEHSGLHFRPMMHNDAL